MRPEFATHLRALLIALGLYAAGALVWFVGPLLSVGGVAPLASDRARAVAIAGVVLLFVLHLVWRAWRSSRRNRRLLDGMLPAAGARTPEAAAPGAPEVAVISQRFAQALQVLRRRQVGARSAVGWLRRRPYVYELPWYIIIGAPGAGKTTTIVNSGLEFPFASELGPKALRGAGGTRNCDWWFTSDAVLIDTAGRYTTQDSYREADRAAWLGFLQLLVTHRPRQPINGVILTLSATDLLQPDAERKRTLAREMRERIGELHTQLGIRFPIYVMVTKCDLLAGFAEFFADFDKDERAQVWGTTLSLDATPHTTQAPAAAGKPAAAPAEADTAARLARLSAEMVTLEKSLHDCLIARLHDERDRERRSTLFGFPQQWRVLRDALGDMLRMTFESSAGATTPLLRGVYFTSATQEGSPMDRALGALSRALGLAHRVLPPGRPSGRSYFVTRLLREVVLGEAGLAGTNRRWERQRAWLHGGVVLASVLVTVVALGWAWRQYAASTRQLAAASPAIAGLQAQATAAKAPGSAADVGAMVPLLDGLWSLAREGESRGTRRVTFGLDPLSNLGSTAQDAYHHVLRDALVPRLAKRLEQRLDATGADALFARYEALKAYLMLFGGTHFDAAALRSYLVADWDLSATPVGSAAARKALREHLDRLLATGEVGAPSMADANLVARMRAQLTTAAPAQRVLARLRQGDATPGATTLSIEPAALATAQKVLTRASGVPLESGVSPLYARAGQTGLRARVQDSVRQLDEEAPWVLGMPAGAPDVAAHARLVDAIDAQLAVERLRAWDALVFDLRLLPVSSLAAGAEQARVMSRPDSPLNAWLAALLRDMGPTASGPVNESLSAEADRLNALRAYTLGTPAGYEVVHAAVGRVATQLAAIDDAATRKAAPPAADAWQELAIATARTPEPLRTLWQQLGEADAALAFGTLRELWSQQLAVEVAPACARVVDGRYPFTRQSTAEVAREDFARAFASGGVIDGFFQRYLAGWVDMSTRPWGVRGAAQGKWGDALLPFQRAQAIRAAFFGDGGRQFGVRMDLRLLDLDPGIGALTIDVDGQAVRFARDSRHMQTLQWPGPGGAGRIQLQASAPGGAGGTRFTFEGPWSLLRLFERVRIEPGSGGRVVLVFDVEGRKARLEAHNPQGPLAIALPELEQFQCPRRL
ncbi:MAG TPA: type VI secretion system membrane subunit TssM [Burkholderiaceae bacterium]|nr:type VI secretion system membrane subunit TssM [Burkholderiaceae bacterium]